MNLYEIINYHKFLGDSCQGLGTAPSSSVRSEALCLGKKPAEQKERGSLQPQTWVFA